MKNSQKDLKKYRSFLETIPLDKYREELKDIKWVEQDLVPQLFPLKSIYTNYWEERIFLSFEDWFDKFWNELQQNQSQKIKDLKELVRAHRKFYEDKVNNNLNHKVFLGFKARMYRTWTAVLTQLDFCYMFEYVCLKEGKDLQLETNAELDAQGIDAKVNNICFQVKKISQRKEALRLEGGKRKIAIPYVVWNPDELKKKIQNPRTRIKNTYQKMVNSFEKYFIKLINGFVVFNENYLKPIIDNIDDIDTVRSVVKKISLELSGES